jgi:3-isopropylmalate/(R)-2-methylmalate dehydratase large subunit
MQKTLFDKIWDSHVVVDNSHDEHNGDTNGPSLIYIDRHLIHEVTSPQAFASLKQNGRKVRRPGLTMATTDHNVSTENRSLPIVDEVSKMQLETLSRNCKEFGITIYDMTSPDQGIVHVIGPELGFTLPGTTIVCGDSHTSTHGAFGALAFGIGTSEVEHVLATQCIWMYKPISFLIKLEGNLRKFHAITSKDIILKIIHEIGTDGGSGSVIEYRGEVISALSMEQRMTICNMSIEGGARAGLIAPDETTFNYLRGRRYAPKEPKLDKLIEFWKNNLKSDSNVKFDRVETINVDELAPQVTWGTNPSMVVDITDHVPSPEEFAEGDENKRKAAIRALEYMNLEPGTPMIDVHVDRVFIGSCTNSRLEDLIEASLVIKGRKVSSKVRAMIVPGSQKVKLEAETLGLDSIFKDSGFEWRESGCSMCLGMNSDILSSGERCASTSNRNFEGRQGAGGRTHLVSPIMAAACAIEGHFVDVRDWL